METTQVLKGVSGESFSLHGQFIQTHSPEVCFPGPQLASVGKIHGFPQLLGMRFVLPAALSFLLSYYKAQIPEINVSLNGPLDIAFSFERENTTEH